MKAKRVLFVDGPAHGDTRMVEGSIINQRYMYIPLTPPRMAATKLTEEDIYNMPLDLRCAEYEFRWCTENGTQLAIFIGTK